MEKKPVSNCNLCGLCNAVCPIFRAANAKETFSPRFKVKQLQDGVRSKLLYLCTDCGACEASCPNDVGMNFVEERSKLVDQGKITPIVSQLIANFKNHRDPYYDWE